MFILLVEDNPVEAALTAHMLEKALDDCEVVIRGSAEEALRVCADTPPDLIISDIHLPGEDGYQLCNRIRQKGSPCCQILFLMISADENKALTAAKAMAAGAYAFDAKPLSRDKFLSDVCAGLRLAKAQRERHDFQVKVRGMANAGR